MNSTQMHRERIGQALTLGREPGFPDERLIGHRHSKSQYYNRLVGQAEAVERIAGTGAAFERSTD